jgi:hypothetical protein
MYTYGINPGKRYPAMIPQGFAFQVSSPGGMVYAEHIFHLIPRLSVQNPFSSAFGRGGGLRI